MRIHFTVSILFIGVSAFAGIGKETLSYEKLTSDCKQINRKGGLMSDSNVSCHIESRGENLIVQISTETYALRPISYWLGDRKVEIKLGKLPMRNDCGRIDVAVRYRKAGSQGFTFTQVQPKNECAAESLVYDRKAYARVVGLTDWVSAQD